LFLKGTKMSNYIEKDFDQEPKFSIGRVLQRTFSIYLNRFWLFIGLTVLFSIPNLFSLVVPFMFIRYGLGFLSPIMSICLMGAVAAGVMGEIDEEQKSSGECLSESFSRFFSLIFMLLVFFIMMFGLGILVSVPVIFLAALVGNIREREVIAVLFLILSFLITCGVFWIVTSISVSVPVCVLEQEGAMVSISRSRKLTKGRRLRIFVLLILVLIAVIIIVSVIPTIISIVTGAKYSESFGIFTLSLFMGSILGTIPIAFFNVMIGVIYSELVSVKEDLSLDKLAEVFE
jgi:hypothetical protein